MLFHLVIWPLIAASAFLWGLALLRLAGVVPDAGDERARGDAILAALWSGCAVLAGLFPLAALFVPLTPEVAGVLLLAPCLTLIPVSTRQIAGAVVAGAIADRRTALTIFAMQVVALAVIAWLAASQIIYFDTAVYHLPMARMLEEFGAVTGLVGLFSTFGQTSSWFALSAPGTAGGETGWGAQTASFFLAGLAAVHAASALRRMAGNVGRLSDFIAGIAFPLVLIFAVRWSMLAALTPDLPAMLLAVTVAWALSLDRRNLAVATGLLVAGFAVTAKLSAAPIGLVAAGFGLLALRDYPRLVTASAGLSLAIVLPSLAVGLITSGCLAFPVGATCFELPWTPDPETLTDQAAMIVKAARGGGHIFPADTSFGVLFNEWMRRDTSGAVLVLGGIALSLAFVSQVFRARWTGEEMPPLWPAAVGLLGVVYVVSAAPTGRFVGGYAALLSAVILWCVPSLRRAVEALSRRGAIALILLLGMVAIHVTGPGAALRSLIATRVAAGIYMDPGSGIVVPRRIVPFDIHRPMERVEYSHLVILSNGHVEAAVSNEGECWAAPPPCAPAPFHNTLRYRDPARGVAGGYRTRAGN